MFRMLKSWRWLIAGLIACGGVAYAAVRQVERMIPAPYLAALIEDPASAKETLEPHSPVLALIEAGELEAAREQLAFQPLAEAPIPEGFPAFTPVGVIEVKRYPVYRKAVGPSFWPLFNHIQTQGIPMTAPVEMTTVTGARGDGRMAFLYQATSVGQPGPIDGVAVEDTPETIVASLGVRGRFNEDRAEEARATLLAWLADQSDYRRVGEGDASFRLFGYNSPMVRDNQKYWEAQLLIEKAPPETADQASRD